MRARARKYGRHLTGEQGVDFCRALFIGQIPGDGLALCAAAEAFSENRPIPSHEAVPLSHDIQLAVVGGRDVLGHRKSVTAPDSQPVDARNPVRTRSTMSASFRAE
jgi:hypothetical protein